MGLSAAPAVSGPPLSGSRRENRSLTAWPLSLLLLVGCATEAKRVEVAPIAGTPPASLGIPAVATDTGEVWASADEAIQTPPKPTANAGERDTRALLSLVSLPKVAGTPGGPDADSAYSTDSARSTSGSGDDRLRHAGVAPDSFRDLTENEMVQLALQHSDVLRSLGTTIMQSPTGVATRWDPSITATDPQFGPAAALSAFDTQWGASLTSQNNDRVFNNATLGGDVQELVQDYQTLDTGWTKRTTWGTQWDLRSLTIHDANNRAANRFPSYWETTLELGVRQPLLRGAGRQFQLIAGPDARPGFQFSRGVWVAQIGTELSRTEWETRLRDYFVELYTAYWELHRQYQLLEPIEKVRGLSYKIWQQTRAKQQAGLPGGETYNEAQAENAYLRATRRWQVALGGGDGQSGLYQAERQLRRVMGLGTDGSLLRPVDSPAEAKFQFDVQQATARAVTRRAELRRQELDVQQQRLQLIAAKNFLLPQVDLIGRTRTRGFGDDLIGQGPRFSDASEDFFSFDHQEWEFGLEMSQAVGRRQARVGVRHAALKLRRSRELLRQQQQAVRFEVLDAIAEVESSYQLMQTSRRRVDAADRRLRSSEALFDAGKIRLEFLLEATRQWLEAKSTLAEDQRRYTISLIGVSRSTGTLLEDLQIHVSHDAPGGAQGS